MNKTSLKKHLNEDGIEKLEWCSPRQAIEWITFGKYPIPTQYDISLRDILLLDKTANPLNYHNDSEIILLAIKALKRAILEKVIKYRLEDVLNELQDFHYQINIDDIDWEKGSVVRYVERSGVIVKICLNISLRFKDIESLFPNSNVIESLNSNEAIEPRERKTLIKLIAGLLAVNFGVEDLLADKIKSSLISEELNNKGIVLHPDTIRKYLREALTVLKNE